MPKKKVVKRVKKIVAAPVEQEVKTDTVATVEAVPPAPELPVEAPPKVRELIKTIYLFSFIACLTVGFGAAWMYFTTLNIFFGYVFVPPLIAALILFSRWRKRSDETQDAIAYAGKPIATAKVNSLNIYPAELGGIIFEDVAKPEGQPWMNIHDDRAYFVHVWDVATKKLKPLALPDQQYCDPRTFAERVLELPAHKELFTRKQGLLQKASPFIGILVILILWILIITTTGQPPAVAGG